jgi:hypothetical protein
MHVAIKPFSLAPFEITQLDGGGVMAIVVVVVVCVFIWVCEVIVVESGEDVARARAWRMFPGSPQRGVEGSGFDPLWNCYSVAVGGVPSCYECCCASRAWAPRQ